MYYKQSCLLKDFQNIDLSTRKIQIHKSLHQEQIVSFLKQWYKLSQDFKDEQQYAFNIQFSANAFDITDFITFLDQDQMGYHKFNDFKPQQQQIDQLEKYFIRSYGNTHLIRVKNQFIGINPSKKFIGVSLQRIFLTNGSLSNITNCLDFMISSNKSVVLVTTQKIYIKMLKLCEFLFGKGKYTQLFPCMIVQVGRHFYKILGLLFLFRRNMWYEPSYDLLLNHDGKIFAFQENCIRQQKIIYPAWKKQLISEQRYLQLLYSPEKYYWRSSNVTTFGQQIKFTPIDIIKINLLQFLRKVPLFYCLDDNEIIQLGQLIEQQTYTTNSIISKKGMRIDKVYIVYEGQVIKDTNHKKLMESESFGYEEWLTSQKKQYPRAISTYSTTNKSSVLLSIHMKMLDYFLHRHIQKMKQILQCKNQIPSQLKIILQSTLPDEWEKAWIFYYCKQAEKVQQFRLKETKIISLGQLKLFLQQHIWYRFCKKNLQMLLFQRQSQIK